MIVELPFPPSVNTYWRHVSIRGRRATLLSKRGREYKALVGQICQLVGVDRLDGPLAAIVDLYPPTNARRDCDNFLKAPIDALQGHLYADDSQIVDLRVRMHPKAPPGSCRVTVRPAGDAR